MGTGLPQKVLVKHRYVESFAVITEAIGTSARVAYVADGMTNPRLTVGGLGTVFSFNPTAAHQPLYFDQYNNLYDHYTILGSKITFKIRNRSGALSNAFSFCAHRDDNTTAIATTAQRAAEQTQGRSIVAMSGNQNESKNITLKYSAKKTFGGSILANEALQGNDAGNPNEGQYFVVTFTPIPEATLNIYVDVEIEYVAIWRELREVAQSEI